MGNAAALPERRFRSSDGPARKNAHEGPIRPVLDVARFLAAGVIYYAAFIVVWGVLTRRSPVRKASRMKQHFVLLGDSDDIAPMATQYRQSGHDVVVVGEVSPADLDHLTRSDVVTVPLAFDTGLRDAERRKILHGAQQVVVLGGSHSSQDLAEAVRGVSDEPQKLTVLFGNREFALNWTQRGEVALCRTTQLVTALLRMRPPFLEDTMVPPPIVIGDGEDAAEIVRRIVTGWQQPGERLTIHCLGRDSSWTDSAKDCLDDLADLRFERIAPQSRTLSGRIAELVTAWQSQLGIDDRTLPRRPISR